MTIKELAAIAGLNHSTVSRALNDSPLISEKTRLRVRELAEEYNFDLNASARGMRTRKTDTIGVIFPVLRDSYRDMQYLGSLMNSLRFTIEEELYDSIITFPVNPKTGRSNIRRLLQQKKVDGLLLVVQDVADDDWEMIVDSGVPVVSLHFKWADSRQQEISYVYPDNFRGGYLASDCLLRAGCRRTVTLTAEDGQIEFDERTRGYFSALESSGIGADAGRTFYGSCGFESGYNFIYENRELLTEIDGIFAQTDMNAIGAIEAMKELGIRVPQDIAVVGYDDIDIDYFFKPRLTTVHQPKELYSEIACRKLVEMIENGNKTEKIRKVIEPDLLIRESCVIEEVGDEY